MDNDKNIISVGFYTKVALLYRSSRPDNKSEKSNTCVAVVSLNSLQVMRSMETIKTKEKNVKIKKNVEIK